MGPESVSAALVQEHRGLDANLLEQVFERVAGLEFGEQGVSI
jgi:hypothetical protein